MQMRDQQMQQLQRAQQSQDAANKVVASFPRRADGTYDVGGMIQQMSGSGVHPADVEHYGRTFESLNQLSTAAVEAQRQHQARAADIILSGAQGKEITPEDVHVALATLKTLPGGLVNDEDEQAWTQAFAAGQDPRKFLESVSRAGKGPQKPITNTVEAGIAAGMSPQAVFDREKPPVPPKAQPPTGTFEDYVTRKYGQNPTADQVVAARKEWELPKEGTPRQPPQVGSFEDYVTRTYGATPTPAQVLQARKDYGQADDRPRVNVNVPGAPQLTQDAIEDTATRYRILGTGAIPTRIEGPERVRVMNEAAKQQRALGQSAAQGIQKMAANKADAASLTKMQSMADAASASEAKALAQADLVGQLSSKVNRSQSPLWNDWLLSGKKKVLGDQDTTLLFNALDTFTSEYAKIINGSTGSVAGASDSATRKAEGLVSAALNKGTLQATIDQMKWEMGQTIKGYGATIEHINDRLQTGAGGAPAPTAAPAPAGGRKIVSVTPVP
jgi:hypothetical protein